MDQKCDDCGGKLKIDVARAEGVCEVCCLVHEHVCLGADTNSASSLGDGRHNEIVNHQAATAGARHGGRMNVKGDFTDGNGNRLTTRQRRRARRMAQLDRSSQRDTDPMFQSLMATIQEMFGVNLARAVEPLARATARKLTPDQEARRRTLNANERRMLKCPKTSICRAGGEQSPELRGSTDVENLQIMALAIASIASKWFRTVSINEKQLMEAYGITQKQLVNAKKIIQQHYKARIRLGWAPLPQQLHAAAAREDELDKAVNNLNSALSAKVAPEQLDEVMNAFFDVMSGIGEPSIDSSTANIAISMVAGCVMYTTLQKMGLEHGNLSCIAKAVGRSGAGIKSRIELLKEKHEQGGFPKGATLFVEHAAESEAAIEQEPSPAE